MFTFLCNKLNLIDFLFTLEENLINFQEMELQRNGLAKVATWLMQKESITHNSNFS